MWIFCYSSTICQVFWALPLKTIWTASSTWRPGTTSSLYPRNRRSHGTSCSPKLTTKVNTHVRMFSVTKRIYVRSDRSCLKCAHMQACGCIVGVSKWSCCIVHVCLNETWSQNKMKLLQYFVLLYSLAYTLLLCFHVFGLEFCNVLVSLVTCLYRWISL